MTPDIVARQHATRVLDIVRVAADGGDGSGIILRSWARCANDYALNPGTRGLSIEGSPSELGQHRADSEHLLVSARTEMANLFQQLANRETVVVVADAQGIILDTVGDGEFLRQAARIGMCPGGNWSERAAGTNGVGTCIAERRSVIVDRGEHFFPELTRLFCTGAPIFDDANNLVGVLDVTSEVDLSQQHYQILIGMAAQTIGNQLFEARFASYCIVHMHSRRELLHTFHEGLLAVDDQGRVLAANQSALFQLGITRRRDFIGRDLRDIFDLSLGELVSRGDAAGGQPVPVRSLGDRMFFAAMWVPKRSGLRGMVFVPDQAARSGELAGRSPVARMAPPSGRIWGDRGIEDDLVRALRIYERGVYVMLAGETGCGKEIFAKALHEAGSRAKGPFVAVNCAAVPENLIESELFGYRSGAFTGASKEGRRGRILSADKGTLLLDEIGDMPLALQARLLRVLEEREVTPLGSESSIKVDVRVVCATHRDLREMVAAGSFRSDLYFRLAGFTIQLPPLRDRPGRGELIHSVLADTAPGLGIDDAALLLLENFSWPGNLRQLRNVLQTACALCDGDAIGVADLPPEVRDFQAPASSDQDHAMPLATGEQSTVTAEDEEASGMSCLDLAERDALLRLLRLHRWNVTRVASELRASRNTVYRKVNQYGLVRE